MESVVINFTELLRPRVELDPSERIKYTERMRTSLLEGDEGILVYVSIIPYFNVIFFLPLIPTVSILFFFWLI